MNIPESKENKNPSRPNEHRAWFVDQSVINFLWAKGWSCCQAEACDWWHYINENLKRDLFTSEQEWKDFKERGILPTKHLANWAKLTEKEQTEIEKECWNSSENQWYLERLLADTLKKVSQKNQCPKNEKS